MVKRLLDIIGALVAIALFSPLIALSAVLIRITSGEDPIFRQERVGRGDRLFVMYKFRTMRPEVDPYAPSPHSGEDPRLTRIGRFLRETSLDELPQLWNVLEGNMSMVGPRPLYQRHAEKWNDRQRRRLEVRPGLTGLAQISGRGGLTIEDKLELDVSYVETRNTFMDLKIIAITIINLFRRGGDDIYEDRYSRDSEREESVDSTPDKEADDQ